MVPRFRTKFLVLCASFCTASAVVFLTADATAAEKQAIKKPKFDPTAEKVDLFDGMESGQFDVTMIAIDSTHGRLLIENKTDKPLSVAMPKSFVGVHELKQDFGAGGGYGAGGGAGGTGGAGGGAAQPVGGGGQGGFGGGGGGGFGGGGAYGGGGAFFSIPPEKIVEVPYKSVCLAHGKPEPRARMKYRPVRTEDFSQEPVLQELLEMYASNRMSSQSAQAAVWHVTDNMSWQELSNKSVRRLGGRPPTPYFQPNEIYQAQGLFASARHRVEEKEKEKSKENADEEPQPERRPVRSRVSR